MRLLLFCALLCTHFFTQAQAPCEIFNLTVTTGDCYPDSTYTATINFEVANPTAEQFDVWANNQFVGTYPLSAVPFTIQHFPYNGGANDVVKVCMKENPNCCRIKEFPVPACINNPAPCEIYDLAVTTGDCHPDSTYVAVINFQVSNTTNGLFDVWGNNIYLGSYALSALPITIQNFPYNGGANDVVKVCINDNSNCCRIKEFPVPACVNNPAPCEIYDLAVTTGDCHADSTYVAVINFQVSNTTNGLFDVWGNNIYLGSYALSALPITIQNFPYNGGANDVVKVCINDNSNCCRIKEFPVPACVNNPAPCEIYDLAVTTGDCHPDSTYVAVINFQVSNTTNALFDVWGNNIYLGSYALSALPITIQNFPYNGGANDVVKVCINDNSNCCRIKEFPVPACINNPAPCEIYDLAVTTGDCHPDSTYVAVINFQVSNTTNGLFDVWGNNIYLGSYALSALPITIQNFPYNGGANDVVKVCINDNSNCCRIKEFPVPACINNPASCEIYDLTVTTGDCHADSTYLAVINFQVSNTTNGLFDVWGNNIYLGSYALSALPITIQHFPYNGGANDVVKVCINDNSNCCRIKEFPVPACINNPASCEIYDLTVTTGDCHPDSTYVAVINFQVSNTTNGLFNLWANNIYLGSYALSALPITIQHFPYNGGANDVVKVCINDNSNCCRIKEFPVPACINNPASCEIYDLQVVTTSCLCGQFFAVLTFNHENGGGGGVDIAGNGTNYGNFPYSQQPVILGPLEGNETTMYEFVVKDHEIGGCKVTYELGKVGCPDSPVAEPPGDANLMIAPNPATDMLSVTAMIQGNYLNSNGQVAVYNAEGRKVYAFSVNNASSFNVKVSDLPSGTYRLVVDTELGRLNGVFTKI